MAVRKIRKKVIASLSRARDVAKAASNVKAVNIKVLDLRRLASFVDYFVICSGRSDRQVRAISDSVIRTLQKKGAQPIGLEGYNEAQWILIDYGDVIAHVFYPATRDFYGLERLWADAREVKDL